MFKSISSLLFFVKDLEATKKFYETLGFNVTKDKGMVTFRVNWFEMNFIDREHSEFKSGFDGELGRGMFVYIKVDDVDSFYKKIIKKGIKPVGEPKDWDWGNREFVIKDPDGYRLVFFTKTKNSRA